jgi:Ca2+-binding RTX toxin-like protein
MRGFGPTQRKITATLTVLAAFLAGAAVLQAAVGLQRAPSAPLVFDSAGGSMSVTSSKGGGAIFSLGGIAPGLTGQGEVTISNGGTLPGTLSLASTDLTDLPGRFGGTLSERLLLRIEEIDSGQASEVYSGQVAAMPELELGALDAGEDRAYRFLVTMLDGGSPSSPFVDDNIYQRGSTDIGYRWTLTETEGGSEPPATEALTTVPPPPPPVPPAGSTPLIGTPGADLLIGTSGDDVIYGRDGADRIYGRKGRDHLFGGRGPDRLNCGPGRDVVHADQNDHIKGCEKVLIRVRRAFVSGAQPG